MFLTLETDNIMQIVNEIQQLSAMGINIKLLHVRGRQDNIMQYPELPRPAQLNVDADKYA